MKTKRLYHRNINSGKFLELFIVSAVASILGIRLFLRLSGYPQLGGQQLHIAHMLWGGLLMLIAITLLFSYLNRAAEYWAAILGGTGFGTFIDEVGKFVTQDNNYFFEPSIAIMYVIFVLLFLVIRTIQNRREYSQQEYLLNALREMEEVVLHDLDKTERNRALSYLSHCGTQDRVAIALQHILEETELVSGENPDVWERIKNFIRNYYQKVISFPGFYKFLILFFAGQFIFKLLYALTLIFIKGFGWEQIMNISMPEYFASRIDNLTLSNWLELLSSFASGIFVLLGIFNLRFSRLRAYRMFERSILISIMLTQVFVFYREQFGALLGLMFNLSLYVLLRFMIEREKDSDQENTTVSI